jgi:autotransporter strand-loop-strand O-heptosyltransferase
MFDYVLGHTSFLGHTGYASHARNFFTALNKLIPVRIRNYAYCDDNSYLTKEQNDMLIFQTWNDKPYKAGIPFKRKPTDKVLNIILMECNHHYYYDKYEGPVIGYCVWESTRFPKPFFQHMLNMKMAQFWTPSNWQSNCAVAQGMDPNIVKVVPEGVDGKVFFPEDLGPYNDKRFKFLYFGRWDYRKSTGECVRAFLDEFLGDEPVNLILSADNPYPVDGYNSTEERLEKYKLQDDRIEIVHFPPRKDYIEYLKKGHVFLSCARSEGWGLPAIEAMACGTPTIISDYGAQLEYGQFDAAKVNIKGMKPADHIFMQSEAPGEFAEPDFEHLGKVMRSVYDNYDSWKTIALKASDKIREVFTWENAAKIAMENISAIDTSRIWPVKLNLGSGIHPREGYVNVDLHHTADQKMDALKLTYDDGAVGEVYSSHLLEHFGKNEVPRALREWSRVLRDGGKLELEIPDLQWCLKNFLDKPENEKWGFPLDTLFGIQDNDGEYHKTGFSKERIKSLLSDTGFINISIRDVWSHDQNCFHVQAIKGTPYFSDDIFILDVYADTPEKLEQFKIQLKKLKLAGKSVAVVTHYPLPLELQRMVEYYIYDGNNILSEGWTLNWWYVIPKVLKLMSSCEEKYHAAACYSSLYNGVNTLMKAYKWAYFVEFDIDFDVDLFLKNVYIQRERGKKFAGFYYKEEQERNFTEAGLAEVTGIVTNLFGFDLEWLASKLAPIKTWGDYGKINHDIVAKLGKQSDLIFENWFYYYFEGNGMLTDSHFFSREEKNKIILNRNIINQGAQEPKAKFMLSETDSNALIVFVLSCSDNPEKFTINCKLMNDEETFSETIEPRKLKTFTYPKGDGYIEFVCGDYSKKIELSQKKTYTETRFHYYDDRVKCIVWNPSDDRGFKEETTVGTTDGNQIHYTFIEFHKKEDENDPKSKLVYVGTPKVEIKGPTKKTYTVSFIDKDTGLSSYTGNIENNCWTCTRRRYYTNWHIKVESEGKLVSEHIFDPTGKNVMIDIDTKAMGDTVAWVPYAEEFRKKYNCKVYLSTYWNKLFDYPEINFIEPGSTVHNLYAKFAVGCRDNDYDSNRNNWRSVPLQKVATDYLGLEYVELRPKMKKVNLPRPHKNKYACITEHSTVQSKYWLHPGGWQSAINYLKVLGYDVMVISKEKTDLKGIINRTNRPIEETINNISHADMFIGVSCGPTWLAWALNVPTILVSGYSMPWGEMKDCQRVVNETVCHGCFNDKDAIFDRGNWNWCPRSKNMICTTSITPEMVISKIDNIVRSKKKI